MSKVHLLLYYAIVHKMIGSCDERLQSKAPSTLSVICGTFTEHSLEKNEIMSGMYDSVINSGL